MKSIIKPLFFLFFLGSFLLGCQKDVENITSPPIANAGISQNIQLPAGSFTLTGSGTTQNGHITGYLWSLISGPNVPVITSPSSPTTTVTGFLAGSYKFQFMVIDNAGLTGIDTTSVTLNPSPIQTLTLQPANNNDERHLFGSATIDQSGHATELDAGTWTVGGSTVFLRGAFKFDLSSIPPTATILTAKLTLYSNPTPLNGNLTNANEGSNNAMYIRRISSNWTPSTTFWLNQPSTTTTDQVSIPHTAQAFLDLVDVDVKNLVAPMHSIANYGFMISLQNEVQYNLRDFCSSTYTNAAKHPKLVITYQP
jgi:hypothetical protein